MYTHRYYLTGEKVNNHIWESNLSSKPKAKRLVNCFSMHINTETRLAVSHTGVSCNLLGVQISREDLSRSLWCFFSLDQTGERIVWKRTGMVFRVKEKQKKRKCMKWVLCHPCCVWDKVVWCVFFWRHSLVEDGLKLPSWWAADLFFRSRVMPDSISNTRQDFTSSTYTNAAAYNTY